MRDASADSRKPLLSVATCDGKLDSGARTSETSGGGAGQSSYISPYGWKLSVNRPTYTNGKLYWLSNLIDGSHACNPQSCASNRQNSKGNVLRGASCYWLANYANHKNNGDLFSPSKPIVITLTLPRLTEVAFLKLDPHTRKDSTITSLEVWVDGIDVTPDGFDATLAMYYAKHKPFWAASPDFHRTGMSNANGHSQCGAVTGDLLMVPVRKSITRVEVKITGATDYVGFGGIELFAGK